MSQDPDPSLHDIDAVLRFLPVVASPDFDPGRMHSGVSSTSRSDEKTPTPPYFEASPELDGLIQTLYDHHFISNFDWSEWQPVAERYAREPSLLSGAGLGTLRKLFTTHVRRERFCDGHLAEVFKSGHLLALLRRLETIRAGLTL
jgi:hypothetical protein